MCLSVPYVPMVHALRHFGCEYTMCSLPFPNLHTIFSVFSTIFNATRYDFFKNEDVKWQNGNKWKK